MSPGVDNRKRNNMLNEFRACLYTFRAHNENRDLLTKWQNVTAICFRHASMEKKYAFGWKREKKECLSPLMDKNYLCLMLVNNRDLPYAFCYFYLPKVWQWRHINDETFPVLQRFCQHKSSGNAHMWQQFAVFQKILVQYMYDVFVYFL